MLNFVARLAIALALPTGSLPASASASTQPVRPKGPCDVYAKAGAPCVAAHSTTRALYAAYDGPLYQVMRQSDSKTLDIGVVPPARGPVPDAGGYANANAKAQDAFCANTHCWITILYDQSCKRNHLVQAPRGTWTGPALGGMDNLPLADLAPVTRSFASTTRIRSPSARRSSSAAARTRRRVSSQRSTPPGARAS